MSQLSSEFEFGCPCCGAILVVDAKLRRLISHRQPPREDVPELGDAQRILAAAAARREAIFERSVADEKGRSDALSKRFDEALKQARAQNVNPPQGDFIKQNGQDQVSSEEK
ncbi:MAG: hypothetical protein F4018_14590 [Acidobacteria bacterium]|nr:hypothetical protein [Acidobacteriota bacterium]